MGATPYIFQQYFDNNGDPLNAGTITAYEAGTVTKKDTFPTAALTAGSENSNPLTLSSSGRTTVFLEDGLYDFLIKDSSGNLLDTKEDIGTATGEGQENIINIDTMDNLKAYSVSGISDGTVVYLSGYYTKGDGGQGWMYWDATSSASDNDGTIVLPDTAPASGRWIRIWDELNVMMFGATGDGSTDDTTSLQNAFTVINTNGGTIIFPEPTVSYLIDGDIGLETGTTFIYVKGYASTIEQAVTGSAYNMFRFRSNMTIEGIELKGYISSGTGNSALPANSYGFRAKGSGGSCDNVTFIKCKSYGHPFDGWYVRDANDGGSVRLIDCWGWNSQRNDFAAVECLTVVIDGGEWGNDDADTKGNVSIDIECGNTEVIYQAEIKNLTCYQKVSIAAPLVGYTIYKAYLNNIIFDGSVYDQPNSNYYSRCGFTSDNLENLIVGNLKYINDSSLKEFNSSYYSPSAWGGPPGIRRGFGGRFTNLENASPTSGSLLPYTTARQAAWTPTTSGAATISDDAACGDRKGIRIQNPSGGYANLKYSITGGYKLTLSAAGYTNAVAGDISKTVVGATSGAQGTLDAYDNVTRIWDVTSTNYIAFQNGEDVTIVSGTGDGAVSSSALDTSWADEKQFSFGCMMSVGSSNPDYDAGMWVVLNGALNESGSLQTQEYLIRPTTTNTIEKCNSTFFMPDGVVGIDIYIGSASDDYTYDLTFADMYFCRGFVDNEQAAGFSTKIESILPVTIPTGVDSVLPVTGKITAAGGILLTGGAGDDGSIRKATTEGLSLRGVAGSSYDFFINGAGGTLLMRNPTGTTHLQINRILMQDRFQGKKGSDVASANDITLGTANYFVITGTTTLQRILTTDWQGGSEVILELAATIVVQDGVANGSGYAGFDLASGSNFTVGATGGLIKVAYNGDRWKEVSRTDY